MAAKAFATKDRYEIELLIAGLEEHRDTLELDLHEAGDDLDQVARHKNDLAVIDNMLLLLKGEDPAR